MITSDTGVTFQYDAEGRMISTNNGSYGTEINNALGQRVVNTWPGAGSHGTGLVPWALGPHRTNEPTALRTCRGYQIGAPERRR